MLFVTAQNLRAHMIIAVPLELLNSKLMSGTCSVSFYTGTQNDVTINFKGGYDA